MNLKNILLVVSDLSRSFCFYHEIFGLELTAQFDHNLILTQGLVLQEQTIWEASIKSPVTSGVNHCELYFEENSMDSFASRLEESRFEIRYLTRELDDSCPRKTLRFYDPDGHLIEVSESTDCAKRRTQARKRNIVIAGIGGVGGFLSAALTSAYPGEVSLFARGARKEALQQNGLILKSEFLGDRQVSIPLVSDCAEDFGIADILFICVKNYSLKSICAQLEPMVGPDTIIVPVLNGVDPADRTREYLPEGIVVDSLIYIVSGAQPDFSILQQGDYAHIHIGTRSAHPSVKQAVQTVNDLIVPTGVTCVMEDDIEAAIWKKYIFNCAFNITTAACLGTVGDVKKNTEKLPDFCTLMEEACAIAKKKGVSLPEDFARERYQFFLSLPSEDGTSSLCRDLKAGRQSELETFSGYLLAENKHYQLSMPKTEEYYQHLKKMEDIHKAEKLYEKGMAQIREAKPMDAMASLGDALYIRRKYFKEEDLEIREIYYALEQCTFM